MHSEVIRQLIAGRYFDRVEIRLDRGHVLAGAKHLLALCRQTHLVFAAVFGVRHGLVMLSRMGAGKGGRRRENERPDPRWNPMISDHHPPRFPDSCRWPLRML